MVRPLPLSVKSPFPSNDTSIFISALAVWLGQVPTFWQSGLPEGSHVATPGALHAPCAAPVASMLCRVSLPRCW